MTNQTLTGTGSTGSTAALHRELDALLETAAHLGCSRYGGSFVVIDRTTGSTDGAEITLHVAGVLVDLWDLDPLLWDDVHWAAVRAVPVGQARVVMPRLHRD